MYFTSLTFIIFLGITLALYYLFPKKCQLPLLFVGNMVFYVWAGPIYACYLWITMVSVFHFALEIQKIRNQREEMLLDIPEKERRKKLKKTSKMRQKRCLHLCFWINFGILGVLKYLDFVMVNLNKVLEQVQAPLSMPVFNFILPLGLSFYTFQSISYILEVYWEKEEAETSFLRYATFASFFPQMIQGPISKYSVVSTTMFQEHSFDLEKIYQGFVRVLYGYFKKLVIADRLLPLIPQLTGNTAEYQGVYFLLTMGLYAIALFGDFTGGIDITIGVGKMFGITLEENFNRPYLSRSIAEYWRRWHMTMGVWFKTYLFYPLSVSKFMLNISSKSRKKLGNAWGKRVPLYITTLTIWFCTGFWHGASWNYIAWGLSNGIIILISKELEPLYARFHKKFPKAKENKGFIAFTVFRTFWLMCFIRAFDCYHSVATTISMQVSVFTNFSGKQFLEEGLKNLSYEPIQWWSATFGVAVVLLVTVISSSYDDFFMKLEKKSWQTKTAVVYFLIFSIFLFGAYGMGYDGTQFIYNQF